MAGIPTKLFLYFIVDSLNRSRYVDTNGAVQVSSSPIPLPQHPRGWKDIQISFGTNQNYWSLLRSFTAPLFFVGAGATICRHAIYSGKGYEEELYLVLLRWNPATGVYDLEYKGRLDFTKHIDEPRKGITVNTIEGGVLSYLTANDGVDYEIPLAPNNPDAQLIQFDGVTLFDRLRFSMVDKSFVGSGSFAGFRYAVNFPFISNEGDSVGILQGSQIYEDVGVSIQTYTQNSGNWFFSSIRPVQVRITGTLKFTTVAGSSPTNSVQQYFQFRTGPYPTFDHQYTILGTDVGGINPNPIEYTTNQDVFVNVDVTINLAANEKLFFIGFTGINGGASHSVTLDLSDLFISFKTINPPSAAYGISIYDLNKWLIGKMSGGRYTGDSAYFAAHKNLMWTSTNALQNFAFQVYYGAFDTLIIGASYYIKVPGVFKQFPSDNQIIITGASSNNGVYTVLNIGALIGGFTTVQVQEPVTAVTGLSGTISTIPALKINYKDFFNDVNALYNIGMKIVNDVIFIEPKGDIYKPDAQIFDIGELASFKMHYADELLCNTATFGYKSQDYRQRNGVYEFNTTTLFKLPVNTLKKDYNQVLKARADCFGIEFIRSIVFNKPTTDVTGDNQSFIVDTKPGQADVTAIVSFISGAPDLLITPLGINFIPGDIIQFTGSASNNVTVTVGAVVQSFVGNVVGIAPGGTPFVNESNVSVLIHWVKSKFLILNRYGIGSLSGYTAMTGVLDNTVFNTEWTPHKNMLRHGPYLRPLLKQLDSEKVVFQTSDKNSAFSTTLAGVTVAERQDEVVSGLGPPLFMNRYAEFTTVVPINFADIMASLGTGYVKGTFYGIPLYFLPIGKMDAKPAVNSAQVWKMLLAPEPLNDLSVLEMLSAEGQFSIDNMGNILFTSDLNSLHFNRYNYSLPAKYQHKEMYDDQFQNRKDQYVSRSIYVQKWQKTDSIFVQAITKGISTVNVDVYDSNGIIYQTNPMVVTADPTLQLPYVKSNYSINLSGFTEGIYFVVLSAGGVNLRISEFLDVRSSHVGTLLFEYSNTTNKFNTYFTGVTPMLRIEGRLLSWYPDDSHENYTDEYADNELLDGIPTMKRPLRILPVPDWMAQKLSKILLLNNTLIEGVQYSRTPEGKFEKKDYPGHDMKSYTIEISKAKNVHGLITDEVGSVSGLVSSYTLDAQAFGGGSGATINIDIANE